jgi:hemolysin-activating ACP:hemolysin acyltransferase
VLSTLLQHCLHTHHCVVDIIATLSPHSPLCCGHYCNIVSTLTTVLWTLLQHCLRTHHCVVDIIATLSPHSPLCCGHYCNIVSTLTTVLWTLLQHCLHTHHCVVDIIATLYPHSPLCCGHYCNIVSTITTVLWTLLQHCLHTHHCVVDIIATLYPHSPLCCGHYCNTVSTTVTFIRIGIAVCNNELSAHKFAVTVWKSQRWHQKEESVYFFSTFRSVKFSFMSHRFLLGTSSHFMRLTGFLSCPNDTTRRQFSTPAGNRNLVTHDTATHSADWATWAPL